MGETRIPLVKGLPQGGNRFKRIASACAIVAVSAALLWWPSASGTSAPIALAAEATPACAAVEPAAEAGLMGAYRAADTSPATQADTARGTPSAISLSIPPIAFTGPGQSSTLPVGPCQTIYRFSFPPIRASPGATESPFKYAEVDWNTEGLPRGPENSFVSPHFDFHFYLRQKSWVDSHLRCGSSNGRTCDPQKTSYAQMRRFLMAPPATDVPPGYFPGVESSIPDMGLHSLDGRVHYSVEEVNHHPVLLYGSYDGRLLFVEASVTQYNLQDAMEAPSHTLSYVYRQPREYEQHSWPTRFTITYDPRTNGYTAAFAGFRTH
jgi:hypothetical protein